MKKNLEIKNVGKTFGKEEILKNINIEIKKGEFFSLLGPSGCGKTTLLRMIAGFIRPDKGSISINEKVIDHLNPNERNVNTVFQNYALFPNMTVFENVAFPLKIKKVAKEEIEKEVLKYLELVGLQEHKDKMPSSLSGGQKQRVSIARALISKPDVLLLDEPLSALDAKLRQKLLIELDNIHDEDGITFVFVTHDQEEALNMSDRIAVMRAGGFSQIGTPEEIYSRPKTDFVARFVGEANVLKAQAIENDHGILKVKIKGGTAKVFVRGKDVNPGDMVHIAVRSDSIYFPEEGSESCMEAALQAEEDNMSDTFCVEVKDKHFTAGMLRIVLETDDGKTIIASRHGIDSNLSVGDRIHIGWEPANAVIVDEEESDE